LILAALFSPRPWPPGGGNEPGGGEGEGGRGGGGGGGGGGSTHTGGDPPHTGLSTPGRKSEMYEIDSDSGLITSLGLIDILVLAGVSVSISRYYSVVVSVLGLEY